MAVSVAHMESFDCPNGSEVTVKDIGEYRDRARYGPKGDAVTLQRRFYTSQQVFVLQRK